jgi:hypothetical protein
VERLIAAMLVLMGCEGASTSHVMSSRGAIVEVRRTMAVSAKS